MTPRRAHDLKEPLDVLAYALALEYWRGYLTARLNRTPTEHVARALEYYP